MGIAVGPEIQWSPTHQTALLTLLRLAGRIFLGGVDVLIAENDSRIHNCLPRNPGIVETMAKVGGRHVRSVEPHVPIICIGTVDVPDAASFAVRAVFSGWRAGVVPVAVGSLFEFKTEFPLAGMLAAALAVNEAFLFVRQDTPEAGLPQIGVSLWKPEAIDDWWDNANDGPEIVYLPTKLWLIGLGHLGQAYLWALSLLLYERPEEVLLVLQDIDIVTNSTLSTSILSDHSMIGRKKTRAMADALETTGSCIPRREGS